MMNYKALLLVLLVAPILSLSSCDSDVPEPAAESMITLKVNIPVVDEQAVAKSGDPVAPETGESDINKIKFLVYGAGETCEAYHDITISGGTSNDPMWDPATGVLRLIVTPGGKTIYCVANWEDVMSSTSINQSITKTNLEGLLRLHSDVVFSNPPVMSGKTNVTLTGSEISLDLDLKRQIARVELLPMLSTELATLNTQVTITGVKFFNLTGRSYLFERATPANPAGATFWDQTGYTGATSPAVTATTQGAAVRYQTLYYIPENIAAAQQATRMVVRATIGGTTAYYEITMHGTASLSPGHGDFNIERNHTYKYYLTFQGVGELTPKSAGVGNNVSPLGDTVVAQGIVTPTGSVAGVALAYRVEVEKSHENTEL